MHTSTSIWYLKLLDWILRSTIHDPRVKGSPLPRALFVNDVGYLPDGTPMNRAGNAINHPAPCYPKMVENGGKWWKWR